MHPPESFARGTLDTLPFQIAVLNGNGEILFTNDAWDGFQASGTAIEDWTGTDYLGAIDVGEDEHARRSYEGIQSVLSGEREVFTMEYPCHGPDGQQWFSMRVCPFEVGGQRGVAIAHVEITERKLAEIEADRTADRLREEHAHLEHLLDRINGLVQEVTQDVVGAESRSRMEDDVCATFAGTDSYVAAWVGHIDLARERLRPQAAAGPGSGEALSGLRLSLSGEDLHPSARAVAEDEPQVTVDVDELGGDPVVEALSDGEGVEALAALPLSYRDTRYGVLTLYVTDAEAVDDRECIVLAALGRILTHGINARETKRNLSGAAEVRLTVEIGDPDLVTTALSAATDGTLGFRGAVDHDEEQVLAFFTLEGGDPEGIDPGQVHPAVQGIDVLATHEGTAVLEVTADSFLGVTLAEYGGSLRDLESEAGRTRATIELPAESTARSVYDLLTDRYDGVELVGYHEQDHPGQTVPEFRTRLTDRLTTRQLTVLQKAYLGGYYEPNREVTGTDLAESMGISRATFHQHLRAAERKVFEELFDTG